MTAVVSAPNDLSMVKVYLLDQVDYAGPREDDYPLLKAKEFEWTVNLGTLDTMDPIHGLNSRLESKNRTKAGRLRGRT